MERNDRRIWLEIRDLLTGAAFPFIIQLVFSASLIMFADYSDEVALQVLALVVGELLLIGAYVLFGRQNGLTAYRKFVLNEKKRELRAADSAALYKTGEYAVWKGFVIALISIVPYIIIQFIHCVAPNTGCEFLLKYAFGWAYYPFAVIGRAAGEITQWLNYLWAAVLVAIHAAAYYWGGYIEKARQKKIAEAQEMKGKKRK